MRYTAILEREEDGGYVASVPALPGCVSQWDTRDEALANILEAIKLTLNWRSRPFIPERLDWLEEIPVAAHGVSQTAPIMSDTAQNFTP